MRPQSARQSASVVLRGAFGPAMFHPQWLANQGLIRADEAADASIAIVSSPVTQFRVGWLDLHVTEDRLQVRTAQEQFFEPLRDVAVGILEVLRPVNLHMMGINSECMYEVGSEKAWHNVGHALAPLSVWEGILTQPGMASLVMQGKRNDGKAGYVRVQVQPDPNVSFGIAVDVNDHYDLAGGIETAIHILAERWRKSLEQARTWAESIAALGETT